MRRSPAIRSAIAIRHELEVYAVVLVKAGSVPKTSSGKTRRAACREQYLRGELEIVAAWKTAADEAETELAEAPAVLTPRQAAAEEIESWLIERITARLRLAPGDVKVTTPFLELGMGSLDAMDIAAGLERWLGRQLSPTAVYNYPTIAALARWLASPVKDEGGRLKGEFVHPSSFRLQPSEDLLSEVRGMTDQDLEGYLAQELAKQQRN